MKEIMNSTFQSILLEEMPVNPETEMRLIHMNKIHIDGNEVLKIMKEIRPHNL